ncbi:MAG: FliH/SctL family protein [Armatimonadetes bacterium]|nr:FliH/SctL family protein [Armatimonadota bacterium]MCX7969074.1 FliH/SctL family protein [Armatimonadota bacterium]MDW8142934.1 FliH/SctL family protein [Armatimonadota bacterium]
MPVLRQPRYLAQPVSWEEPEPETQSFNGNLPIDEMALNFTQPEKDTGVEIQKVRKEGYEAGYRDGFLAGQQEGYRQGFVDAEQAFKEQQWQQHQHIQQLLNNMAEAIRNEIANFFNRAEEAVTELALEVARKIIEVETKTNIEVVRKAVSQALHELKGGTITVRLHPEDFSLIANDLSWLNLGEGVSVKIVPDETIERGGVVAESEHGFIDLQPHTKLALLQSEVL